MADGRHIGKCWKCYKSPTNRQIWTKLGWPHAIIYLTCPSWCGCHSNGRFLATAHWTFSSYGRLEAESVNQFWWNFLYTTNLESNDSHLTKYDNFFKFKMAFWAPGLRLMRSTVAAKFGWSSGIASANTDIAKPWPLPATHAQFWRNLSESMPRGTRKRTNLVEKQHISIQTSASVKLTQTRHSHSK